MTTSSPENRIGLAIDELEALAAVWSAGDAECGIRVFQLQYMPGENIYVEPSPSSKLLPVELAASRTWNPGEGYRLEQWLTHLHRRWWPTLGYSTAEVALSLPSAINHFALQRVRQSARRCGWETLEAVTHDISVAHWHLRDAKAPITALILRTGVRQTTVSLVTGFKGVVRLRDRIHLDCLSQLLVDEVTLAAIAASRTSVSPNDPWHRRWKSAAQIRQDLDVSAATVVQLADAEWGATATAEVERDELWSALETDVHAVIRAADELASNNGATPREIPLVIVSGSGPLCWPATSSALRKHTLAEIRIDTLQSAASGAAWIADHLSDLAVDSEDLPQTDWHHGWQKVTPQVRQQKVPFQVRVVLATQSTARSASPVQPKYTAGPPRDSTPAPIEGLWNFLLGVASENPMRARILVGEFIKRAEKFRSELDEMSSQPSHQATSPSPASTRLELAQLALESGNPDEAIREAHRAQADAPDDPTVFRRMIEIHVEAADETDDDEWAISWLKCAHAHDQSNRLVHRRIGQRYRRQAQRQQQAGDHQAACQSLEESLVWEPLDEDTKQLLKRSQEAHRRTAESS